mgnify:CR=1 FL=1
MFDKRVAMDASDHDAGSEARSSTKSEIVGRCLLCATAHDVYNHDKGRCHRCRALVLVCDNCLADSQHELAQCQQGQAALMADQQVEANPKSCDTADTFEALLFCWRHQDLRALVQATENELRSGQPPSMLGMANRLDSDADKLVRFVYAARP